MIWHLWYLSYAPINVMPDYRRYRLRVEGGQGWWGNGPLSFPRGGGDLSLPKQHTFRSCGSPTQSQVLLQGDMSGNAGDCTTSASPVGGEM